MWKFNGYLTREDCSIFFDRLGVGYHDASAILTEAIRATNVDYENLRKSRRACARVNCTLAQLIAADINNALRAGIELDTHAIY